MEQYISKAALVAEIENHINRCNIKKQSCPVNTQVEAICDNKICAYKELLYFLNTLEVKEVDLEKSIDDYIYTHDGRNRLALELDWKCCNLTLKGGDEIIKFAKHFFKLGMAVDNKAQKGE